MRSVLLIRPLCAGYEPEFAEPLGIERLAGYLRAHGIQDVAVFDRRLYLAEREAGIGNAADGANEAPGFYDEIAQRYPEGSAPDIVGLSLMTAADVPDALRIITRLQARWPHATFTAGGVFVTTASQQAQRMLPPHVQLQQGEGETQLLALALGDSQIKPQASLSPDEWIVPYRPQLTRYARLRCPVNMQTSRGCPGSCTFCATAMLPPELRRWRPRDLRLVADEMQACAKQLGEAGLPPIFNFVDDDFGPLSRLEELAAGLKRRNLRCAFACEMRLASLAGQSQLAQRLARLHEAGLTRVFVGVESLDAATLASWRKPTWPLKELSQVVDAFRFASITLASGYILWHADQNPEGARAQVERLHELGLYSHKSALGRLISFPGCERQRPANNDGFESMSPESEACYQRLTERTTFLTQQWLQAAIAEPYAEAKAFLGGEHAEIDAIRTTLSQVNEESLAIFREVVRP